jgi:adenine-specific DNA-methyltransferase
MQKIDMNDPDTKSADIVAGNVEALKGLFPDAFTEGKIDFEVLKGLLGAAVDERDEKYGLNWHGKRRARQIALTPSTGTLLPCPEESVDWDTTQNLMIEGDNLEVLKLLQKSYAGKVKLIYIDPPYNTGKDFVYPDDFRDSIKNYLQLTGQIEGGQKISSNTDASGRFHTEWLNMMYPRLKIARNILSNDGAIVVSCDDNESSRLKTVLDEVIGEENFVADVAIITGANQSGDGIHIQKNHEKCYIYAKNIDDLYINRIDKVTESLRNLNDAPTPLDTREDMGYTIYYNPLLGDAKPIFDYDKSKIALNTIEDVYEDRVDLVEAGYVPIRPGFRNKKLHRWRWGKDTFEERRSEIVFRESNGAWGAYFTQAGLNPPKNVWSFSGGSTDLSGLFEGKKVFDYPKSVSFLRYIISILAPGDSLVMDFFAGSGTTAHAVFAQNSHDGGHRRFILIQIPEPLAPDSEAMKMGYSNLFQLGRERVARSASAVGTTASKDFDAGFRVFKLSESNIAAWNPDPSDIDGTLLANAEHLVPGRTEQDVLYELLLKLGLDLCVPIEAKTIAGKSVHSIGGGALIVCLADGLTKDVIEPLASGIVAWRAALAPAVDTRVVFKDAGFADDIAKTNMAAILNQNGITDVRSL